MQRRFLLPVLGVLSFVVVSIALARFLTTEGKERDAISELLQERTNGPVKIIRLDSETAYSIGTDEGWSRVVWARDDRARPVVQCVRVRRSGGPIGTRSVSLLELKPPLTDSQGSC